MGISQYQMAHLNTLWLISLTWISPSTKSSTMSDVNRQTCIYELKYTYSTKETDIWLNNTWFNKIHKLSMIMQCHNDQENLVDVLSNTILVLYMLIFWWMTMYKQNVDCVWRRTLVYSLAEEQSKHLGPIPAPAKFYLSLHLWTLAEGT